MERNEELEQRNEAIRRRHENRENYLSRESGDNNFAMGLVGGLALVGIAALLVITLPDIKRYIKISTM